VWAVSEKPIAGGRPALPDILLLIEVAQASVRYDRGQKGRGYADAQIADVLDVRDRPSDLGSSYRSQMAKKAMESFGRGKSVQSTRISRCRTDPRLVVRTTTRLRTADKRPHDQR